MAAAMQHTVPLTDGTYQEIRRHLNLSGAEDPTALTQFVDDAIQDRLLSEAENRIHAAIAHLTDEEINAMVDEALAEVRAENAGSC
jgi:hypothetical protein